MSFQAVRCSHTPSAPGTSSQLTSPPADFSETPRSNSLRSNRSASPFCSMPRSIDLATSTSSLVYLTGSSSSYAHYHPRSRILELPQRLSTTIRARPLRTRHRRPLPPRIWDPTHSSHSLSSCKSTLSSFSNGPHVTSMSLLRSYASSVTYCACRMTQDSCLIEG